MLEYVSVKPGVGFAAPYSCSKEPLMTPFDRRLNPYIRRMAEDMQVRNLSPRTIDAYTYHVDKFCCFFGKPAEELGLEEIRQYQLHLVNEKKVSWSSFNQAVCGLRFLYEVTLAKPWAVRHIPFGKRPKRLPTVLSDQEASQLLQCVEHPKHRSVLLTCYAAGLRLAEATHLRVADIDGQRAQIRITNGKGRKRESCPLRPGCSTSFASTGNSSGHATISFLARRRTYRSRQPASRKPASWRWPRRASPSKPLPTRCVIPTRPGCSRRASIC